MLFLLSDPQGVIPASLDLELREEGYQVRRAGGPDPIGAGPDTALLMGDAPDLAARVVRAREAGGDVLILTVRSGRDSQRTAELLNLGADDDLIWPLPVREVLARVEAARRVHARDRREALVSLGVTVFDDDRVPEVSGAPLPLSAPEGRILSRLLRNAGRTVTRETLYGALYGYSEQAPSERVIDVHVSHLRRKLKAALGSEAPQIRAVRGVGYLAGPG